MEKKTEYVVEIVNDYGEVLEIAMTTPCREVAFAGGQRIAREKASLAIISCYTYLGNDLKRTVPIGRYDGRKES